MFAVRDTYQIFVTIYFYTSFPFFFIANNAKTQIDASKFGNLDENRDFILINKSKLN